MSAPETDTEPVQEPGPVSAEPRTIWVHILADGSVVVRRMTSVSPWEVPSVLRAAVARAERDLGI